MCINKCRGRLGEEFSEEAVSGWPSTILPDNFGQSQNLNCPPGGSSASNGQNYDPRCFWSNQPNYDNNHGHHSYSRPPYDNDNSNWHQRRSKRKVASSARPSHG